MMDLQAAFDILSKHWILFSCSSLLCYYLGSAIYNLYFNPLAKYPGPFFARISSLPSFYHATTGYRHIWVWQCHQIYGNTCRIQPNEIVFNSPSAFRSIYGNKGNVRKGDTYKVWQRDMNLTSTLTEINQTVHARKKKLLAFAFTDKALHTAETFIIQHVDRWCDLLAKIDEGGNTQNLADLANYLVFDIMCDLAFGKSFDTKEWGEENQLKRMPRIFDNYTSFMYKISRSPFFSTWLWLKSRGLNAVLERFKPKSMELLTSLIHENMQRRIKEEEEIGEESENGRKDILHYLFYTKDIETGNPAFSKKELAIESSLILKGAIGTISNTISAFFFYITRNHHAYQKLTQELRTTFSSADDIKASARLTSCLYLRACLDETLRMIPAGPSETVRIVLRGGLEVNGEVLPEGTSVGTSSWSLSHDEESFRDPWVFRPERWIMDESNGVSAEDVARAQAAFFPFSIGPVYCPGQKLARLILLVMIAKTLYRLEVTIAPGNTLGAGADHLGWGMRDKNVFQVKDALFSLRDGPIVQFWNRKIG